MALVDLYNQTQGNGWTTKTNWLSKAPLSTWFGVTMSQDRVVTLALINNNLTGPLPASFGALDQLKGALHLEKNNLSGPLPASIGKFTQLDQMILSGNKFNGSLPNEMGNLVNLTYLDLGFNKFSGPLPDAFGRLSNLSKLYLLSNNFSGPLPDTLGALSKLTSLFADYNAFSGPLPAALARLSNLRNLGLTQNALSGIVPQWIGGLTNLTSLNLGANHFSGTIPSSLSMLRKLSTLDLSYNQLTGPIPDSIGTLPLLVTLNLNNNQLSGRVPASFAGQSSLVTFRLGNNRFTFDGMEEIASKAQYPDQAIVPLKKVGGKYFFPVGGKPANTSIYWYRNGSLYGPAVGDSGFQPVATGRYWAKATNSIATQLTLYSDSFDVFPLGMAGPCSLRPSVSGNKVRLYWLADCSLPAISFEIEKSFDGQRFLPLARFRRQEGPSGYVVDYRYAPEEPSKRYYRLKATLANGEDAFGPMVLTVLPDEGAVAKPMGFMKVLSDSKKVSINCMGLRAVVVSDISGKTLARVGPKDGLAEVVLPSNGLYLITAIDLQGEGRTQKIVIP